MIYRRLIIERYSLSAGYESILQGRGDRWNVGIDLRCSHQGLSKLKISAPLMQLDSGMPHHGVQHFIDKVFWQTYSSGTKYRKSEALLVHRGAGKYTSFESHQWSPRFDLNYFITARQEVEILSSNGYGLKAFEDMFYEVNADAREALIAVFRLVIRDNIVPA